MENADVLETKQIIYYSKGIDESHPKMYILLNLSHYVKRYGHLSQILAFFAMPALQIWPCYVTQEANFEKKLLFPKSSFNIGKICKISGRKPLYFRSYQPKTQQSSSSVKKIFLKCWATVRHHGNLDSQPEHLLLPS